MAQDYPFENDWKLIFGDWCMAKMVGYSVDNKNKKFVVNFRPDLWMRWKHNIPDSHYDEVYNVIKREYDLEYAQPVNLDAKYLTWFLLCDYNNNRCDPAMGINTSLLAKVQLYKEELTIWKDLARLKFLKLKKVIRHVDEFKDEAMAEIEKKNKAQPTPIFQPRQQQQEGEQS